MTALAVFLAGVAAGAVATAAVSGMLASRRRLREEESRAKLAHDLRAPLTSIAAFSEILQDDVSGASRYLTVIQEEAGRLDRMIGERLAPPSFAPDIAATTSARGRAGDPAVELTAAPAAVAASDTPRRVLVVDDDRHIVEATRALLLRAGFETMGAGGGEEGLRQARSRRPDLILMDLTMPDLPGDETLRRLRSDPATRDIPVIITTGDDAAVGLEGAAAVLVKPVSRDRLLDAVSRAISGG